MRLICVVSFLDLNVWLSSFGGFCSPEFNLFSR